VTLSDRFIWEKKEAPGALKNRHCAPNREAIVTWAVQRRMVREGECIKTQDDTRRLKGRRRVNLRILPPSDKGQSDRRKKRKGEGRRTNRARRCGSKGPSLIRGQKCRRKKIIGGMRPFPLGRKPFRARTGFLGVGGGKGIAPK